MSVCKKIVLTISNDAITIQKRVFNAFCTYYLPTIINTTFDHSIALVLHGKKRQFHYSVTLPIEQERTRLQRTKKISEQPDIISINK